MQPASSARLLDGFMAAMWLGAEKPHQGVSSGNQAWHPAPSVCNSTTALGLRAGCAGNRVRSFCSGELFDADLGLYYLRHRYMNPLTGRFMSRDPKEYKPLGPDQQLYDAEVQPIDPRKLHTYLYASADPVNRIDPKGLEDEVEDAMDNLESISKFQNKVRKGQITNRIIDCIQKSFDEVDHVLEDIVRGKIDPGDY
jgi:RHS repeat-associated protein